MRQTAVRLQISLAATLAVIGLAAPVATAGTYDVLACDAAGGTNHSWRADIPNQQLFVSRQWCPAIGENGGFGVRPTVVSLNAPQLASAWWRFEAPAGTTISGVDWGGRQMTAGAGWATRIQSNRGTLSGCGPSTKNCLKAWSGGSNLEHFETGGAQWLRVGVLCLAVRGCATSDGHGKALADSATSFARVRIRDDWRPDQTAGGAGWSADWIRPGAELTSRATDASGISELRLEVDGTTVIRNRYSCDFTRPQPCEAERAANFRLPTDNFADGRHTVALVAVDAAGNATTRQREIGFDSHPPEAPSAPSVEGRGGWSSNRHFNLHWQIPLNDSVAPIAATTLTVCNRTAETPSCLPESRVISDSSGSSTASVDLPSDGEWEARISFEDAAGGSDPRAQSPAALLRYDAATPGPGEIVVPNRWLTREAARVAHASIGLLEGVDAPLSGVQGWALGFGTTPGLTAETFGERASLALGDLPEGLTEVRARAISGSGVASRSIATAVVRIDQSAPDLDLSGGDQVEWNTGLVQLVARGRDQLHLSGMNPDPSGDPNLGALVSISVDGAVVASEEGAEATATLAEDGIHLVVAQARDAAGNRAGSKAMTIRVDRSAPERVRFLPQDDADPRIVRVDASDSTSGLESVGIAIRPISGGDWRELPTSLSGSRATATLDDSNMQNGLWELRAVAEDHAGNTTVTDRSLDGDPAVVVVPLRIPTRVIAGLTSAPGVASVASGASTLRLPNGGSGFVSGVLEDAEGLPIARGLVRVSSAPLMPGSSWAEIGVAITDRSGHFSLRLAPGTSRRVRVRFDGDHRTLASSGEMLMRVASRSSISVAPKVVKVGRTALFKGHLDGSWIPAGGKLVLVQAYIKSVGWQTFSAVRANSDGDWSTHYRFRATVGRVGYRIRVVVPAESGYPFEGSSSAAIRVVAVG